MRLKEGDNMSKDLSSNHRYASLMLDNPTIEYSKVESFQKRMYLLMLKVNEEYMDKLDGSSKLNAYINDFVTSEILYSIIKHTHDNKSEAVGMMRKEIKRIQKMVNNYKTGIVEEYSKEEAAEILKSYMDKESINNYLETMYPKKEVHEDIKIYKRTK